MKTSLYAIGAMMLATTSAMASDPIGERASTEPSWTGAVERAADRSPMAVALQRTFEREANDASAKAKPERSARQWTSNENEG